MKFFLFTFITFLIISTLCVGQSVSIVPNNPVSPTKGTMNYDNVTNVLRYWNGTAWIPLTNAASATGWTLNGTNIYNNNTGQVGVNISTPGAMLHVSGSKDINVNLGQVAFGHQAFLAQTSSTATSETARGVIGFANNSTVENHGLFGFANGSGGATYNVGTFSLALPATTSTGYSYGVYSQAGGGASNIGIYGTTLGGSATNYAGYFDGNVTVTGTLTAGVKPFKIDDPRDPANKYLYHSSIESNEMMNMYRGHVTTDANGEAKASLPSYFMILNKDYEYQLTCIGQFAQAIILEEIKDNQFKIKTDKPNVKVSWQVSGVRQDPVANAYRIVDEVEKPASEKGTYLQPELYKMGLEKATNYLPTAKH